MSKEGTDGNGPQRSLTPVSMTEEELAKAEGDVGPVRYVTNYVNRDQGLVGSVIHTEVNVSYDTQGDIPSSTVLEVITTAVGSAPAPKPGTVVITKAKQGQLPEGWKTFRRMSTVRILSSKLINALRAVVDYYPGQNLLGDTVEIQEPYRFLILHRDQLEKYKSQHPPQHDEAYKLECNRHIDELLKFLDTAMSKKVTEEEQRYSRGVATFENLWLLLKPGERVFIRGSHGRIMPALLHDIKGGWVDGHTEPYRLTLWSIIYNGIVFTRWYQKARLIPFDGEKEIMSLRIYPQNRHVDSDSQLAAHDGRTLQEQMVIWGAKTWGLAKPCLREYHGLTIPVSNEQRRLSRVSDTNTTARFQLLRILGRRACYG